MFQSVNWRNGSKSLFRYEVPFCFSALLNSELLLGSEAKVKKEQIAWLFALFSCLKGIYLQAFTCCAWRRVRKYRAWLLLTHAVRRLFAQAIAAESPEAARRGAEDLERTRTRLLKQACRSREAALGRALRGCDFTGKHAARAFFARAAVFCAKRKKCALNSRGQGTGNRGQQTAQKPVTLLRQRAEDGAPPTQNASMKTGRVTGASIKRGQVTP
jgi:hypothetical protein